MLTFIFSYLSAREMASLQQLFAKAKRWNIVASNYDIDVLLDHLHRTLFRSSLYITHCLHHLLRDKRDHKHAMTLRPRGHNYSLHRFKFLHVRNSFINRSLYKYVKSYIHYCFCNSQRLTVNNKDLTYLLICF